MAAYSWQALHGTIRAAAVAKVEVSVKAALDQVAAAWETDRRGRRRLQTLKALADTFVPAVAAPANAPPLGGFWTRTASDLGVHRAAAGWILTRLPDEQRDGLIQLLDILGATGFPRLPVGARDAVLRSIRGDSDLARGVAGLAELITGFFYGLPDEHGTNPNWQVLGYPGPPTVTPPSDRPRITPYVPDRADDHITLGADVCIIGSGSGGGVIAGVLAQAGLDVVVVEAGGHFEEHNFPAAEIAAYDAMYWRGGWTLSDDGRIKIGAGATLGGGSTVNWSNTVMPPAWVRREWADDFGLKDIDTAAFDEHLGAVSERISATLACSDSNGPNARMEEGAEALGWSWRCATRNADDATYSAQTAGFIGFGDRTGSKQGTLNTYLHDAAAAGTRVLVRTRVERVETQGGRATGVTATMNLKDRPVRVTVKAATVVVAAGALETPAVLLRSSIGGPAVGRNLRLHPVCSLVGSYAEDQRAWWGAPHTRIVDEFSQINDGYGFLIEGLQYGPGYLAGGLLWPNGRDHKVIMSGFARSSSWIGLVRDFGGGRVTLDDKGDSFVSYPFEEPRDVATMRTAVESMARLHEAAGARMILDLTAGKRVVWRRGQSIESFVARGRKIPFHLPYRVLGSAHQMGSARMGSDPATSVADPEGRLHDTAGVWIGDTSAFPTATGSNPMLTCMALARRTAHAILAAR